MRTVVQSLVAALVLGASTTSLLAQQPRYRQGATPTPPAATKPGPISTQPQAFHGIANIAAIVRPASGFRQFEIRRDNRFTPGEQMHVYGEPVSFGMSERNGRLRMLIAVVTEYVDAKGTVVHQWPNPLQVIRDFDPGTNRVHFSLWTRIPSLPAGQYTLRFTFTDGYNPKASVRHVRQIRIIGDAALQPPQAQVPPAVQPPQGRTPQAAPPQTKAPPARQTNRAPSTKQAQLPAEAPPSQPQPPPPQARQAPTPQPAPPATQPPVRQGDMQIENLHFTETAARGFRQAVARDSAVFARKEKMHFYMEVANFGSIPDGAAHRASFNAGVTVYSQLSEVVFENAQLWRGLEVRLDRADDRIYLALSMYLGLPDGKYRLVLRLNDEASGSWTEAGVDIEIRGGEAAARGPAKAAQRNAGLGR